MFDYYTPTTFVIRTFGDLQPQPGRGKPSGPRGHGASSPGTPWSPLSPLSPFRPLLPIGPYTNTCAGTDITLFIISTQKGFLLCLGYQRKCLWLELTASPFAPFSPFGPYKINNNIWILKHNRTAYIYIYITFWSVVCVTGLINTKDAIYMK